jgi:hypothetical protein
MTTHIGLILSLLKAFDKISLTALESSPNILALILACAWSNPPRIADRDDISALPIIELRAFQVIRNDFYGVIIKMDVSVSVVATQGRPSRAPNQMPNN